ncbi:MAG: hypothetical protein ACO3LE_01490 [Bdellovibrionota bacterium]
MKRILKLILCCLLPITLSAEELVVFVVSSEDQEILNIFEEDLEGQDSISNAESFEDYLMQDRGNSDRKRKRLEDLVRKRQQLFQAQLRGFVEIEIDREDPESNADFVKLTADLVDLTFDAISERDFYDKLYLINQSWLENTSEVERFAYLDNALSKENLAREQHHQKLRKIITTATTLVGVGLGAYGSYVMSKKIVPIKADEKLLPLILKWSGRVPVILVGSSVGAAMGSYLGFLGSQWLLSREELYIDPIDGDEDLKDILDIINELP